MAHASLFLRCCQTWSAILIGRGDFGNTWTGLLHMNMTEEEREELQLGGESEESLLDSGERYPLDERSEQPLEEGLDTGRIRHLIDSVDTPQENAEMLILCHQMLSSVAQMHWFGSTQASLVCEGQFQ